MTCSKGRGVDGMEFLLDPSACRAPRWLVGEGEGSCLGPADWACFPFPSTPSSFRLETVRDVCAPAPAAGKETSAGAPPDRRIPAGVVQLPASTSTLFLPGTCCQPSPIMSGTSSAGPNPAQHLPQGPRTGNHPEGTTAPEPPAPATRLCGTRPADRVGALTPRRPAESGRAVPARMRCLQTSPATSDANGGASDGSDPGDGTPPKPPSGSHPQAAPEAEARADPHTPGVPESAPRRASSDAGTPRSRNCAARPDPVPRRQPPPERHEASTHTSPNAARRRSGGNLRNEHGLLRACLSGTTGPTVGDPGSMRAGRGRSAGYPAVGWGTGARIRRWRVIHLRPFGCGVGTHIHHRLTFSSGPLARRARNTAGRVPLLHRHGVLRLPGDRARLPRVALRLRRRGELLAPPRALGQAHQDRRLTPAG